MKNHYITVAVHPRLLAVFGELAEVRMSRPSVVLEMLIDEASPEAQAKRNARALTGGEEINVCLNAEQSSKLTAIAKAWGLSLSATIRYIIFEEAQRRGILQ